MSQTQRQGQRGKHRHVTTRGAGCAGITSHSPGGRTFVCVCVGGRGFEPHKGAGGGEGGGLVLLASSKEQC